MPLSKHAIIASAGSGKTTTLVNEAISLPKEKIVILTYTNNNVDEIRKKFVEINGVIPTNLTIQTWFSFLLDECVRPYQNFVFDEFRIESIHFLNYRSAKFIKKTEINRYFLFEKNIFSDKLAEFALLCNDVSKGLVINRLEKIYTTVFIDEIQDMAGYDLDLIELITKSNFNVTLVGDNRQATYSTNSSSRNERFKGFEIINLIKKWNTSGICNMEYHSISYRCNQSICDLADSLYPEMPLTKSLSGKSSSHDGIFILPEKFLSIYIDMYAPMTLRYDRKTDWNLGNVMNFGECKGLTFQRILIIPNNPIKKFLQTANIDFVHAERAKLYVAITRAVYSVAFLFDGEFKLPNVSLIEHI